MHTGMILGLTAMACLTSSVRADGSSALMPLDGEPGDEFGRALALADGRIVVGAHFDDDANPGDPLTDSGSIYVFAPGASGWTQQAKIVPAGAAGDNFGEQVAASGDTIASRRGQKIGVWTDSGSGWTLQVELDPGVPLSVFSSIALEGDRLAVGAPGGASGSGCVLIYERSSGFWSQTAALLASDATVGSGFGCATALSGDRLAVGARWDGAGGFQAGAAYVFDLQGGIWVESQKLVAAEAQPADELGFALDADGDTVAIGAPLDDDQGSASGSALVFELQGTTWVETGKLSPAAGTAFAQFGSSVSLAGGLVAIGAPVARTATVFQQQGGSWSQVAAHAQPAAESFGTAVLLSGSFLAIGAPGDAAVGSVTVGAPVGGPVVYCTAKTSSGGCAASIGAPGLYSLSAGQPYLVDAVGVPAAVNGMLVYSLDGRDAVPFGGGVLCLQAPVRRTLAVSSGGGAPGTCNGVLSCNFDAWIQSGSDAQLGVGALVRAQYWIRDPGDPEGIALSDAVEFPICP